MITDQEIEKTISFYENTRELTDLIRLMAEELKTFREVAAGAARDQVHDIHDADVDRNIRDIARGLSISRSTAKLCLEAAVHISDIYNGKVKIDE
ncbi:hypothetical protein D3C87_482810 [compost metagenome]